MSAVQIHVALLNILISTLVSPLLNFFKSALLGFCPRRSHMSSTKAGWEEPEKMQVCLMLKIEVTVYR